MLFGVVNQLKEIVRLLYPPLRGSVKRKCFVPHIFGETRARGGRCFLFPAIVGRRRRPELERRFFQFFLEVIRILGIRSWFSGNSFLGVNYSARLLFPKKKSEIPSILVLISAYENREFVPKSHFGNKNFLLLEIELFVSPYIMGSQKRCVQSRLSLFLRIGKSRDFGHFGNTNLLLLTIRF